METKHTTPVIKGLIISFVLILFGVILYITNQYQNNAINSIQYLILVGGIIWSCLYYAKQKDYNVTFGNIFAEGFKTTAFIIGMMAVYTALSVKLIFPEMVDKVVEASREQMQKQGKVTEEQMNQSLDLVRRFFLPFAIGGIIVIFGIVGAVASLIGAAVAKKQPRDPFTQTQL